MRGWLKKRISNLARFMAREMADELGSGSSSPTASTVRIDAADLVTQLGSGKLNQQLIHLFTWNHRWIALLAERNRRTAVSTYDFIESEMPEALFTINQFDFIRSKRDEMYALGGQILDLGVYKGGSTRALARTFPEETIHGFDSFEGLPEDWSHVLKGDFGDIEGILPDMPDNVRLYKGWFDDTLPVWVEKHRDRPISVLRVDCDICSSTKTIFDVLGPQLRAGSWIVFDELIGYRGWEQHEYRAFREFMGSADLDYEFVAYGLTYAIVRLSEHATTRPG